MKATKSYIEAVLNKKISCLIGAVLMIGGAQSAGAATIANYYQAIDLGSFGGELNMASAINDKGQIVGYSSDTAGAQRVFLYENGVMKDIGIQTKLRVFINNKGQIVGNAYGDNEDRNNFIYENGKTTFLNVSNGVVKGVNDNGDIISDIYDTDGSGRSRVVLIRNEVATNLGTLVGGDRAEVAGINDKGQIVGWSATTSMENPHGVFIYTNGVMRSLDFPEGVSGRVSNINNNGDIIGTIYYNDGSDAAFIYNDGVLNLFNYYGDFSFPRFAMPVDVNNHGVAVGSTGGPFVPAAVLFRDGQIFDLNKLIVGDNPFNILISAESINDQGQIVGYGFTGFGMRAFLLNPISVPEPGAAVLIACLGVGFACRRTRAGNSRTSICL